MLRRRGHRTRWVGNGSEAVEAAAAEKFDLILMVAAAAAPMQLRFSIGKQQARLQKFGSDDSSERLSCDWRYCAAEVPRRAYEFELLAQKFSLLVYGRVAATPQ